ncbi:M16 family metallopeptidase [Chondromyces crocatus]|uniref:Peptidase M16 C-terminal domain-containing protein n=1 Tax=Chondromyces crocatus TaxID=52 RepID=A0A0K1E7N2_CHOCO|nr:insulinase family protein [Chondromyces crocatus]AKT36896.1 uncharacterized protein CMC5_010170 [Chondromyces crocatus]
MRGSWAAGFWLGVGAGLLGGVGCGATSEVSRRAVPPAGPAVEPLRGPVIEPTQVREPPPPRAVSRPFRFPVPTWIELASGLRVATVVQRSVPVAEVRVVIPVGMAADEERPGVAWLTGELLRTGGAGALGGSELLAQMEVLGATFTVETSLDATVLRVSAPREQLAPALGLLGQVVLRPRFSAGALDVVKRRKMAELTQLAQNDGPWAGLTTLHRELYLLPMERHPYSSWSPTPEELGRITAADCRAFHARQLAPAGMMVMVAGDVTPSAVRAAAEKAFQGDTRKRHLLAAPPLTDPVPPESTKITLVDRPGALESEIYLGFVGPSRGERDWLPFSIAGQILGGPAGRLGSSPSAGEVSAHGASGAPEAEVQGALVALSASSLAVVQGPTPLVVHATTATGKTGRVVQALLGEAERLASAAPAVEEVEAAIGWHGAALAVMLETPAALVDELVRLRLSGLPDNHHELARRESQDMPAVLVGKVASTYVRPAHGVLVVVGDAAKVGLPLSRFGQVKVIDPTRNFERLRTLPMKTEAPLEHPERASGS